MKHAFANPVSLTIPLILMLAGCHRGGPKIDPAADDRVISGRTVAVQTEPVQRTTVQPATVHPYYRAEIRSRVSGYAGELHADIGELVSAGDQLLTLDVPELEKRGEVLRARIERLTADENRAAAGVQLAKAGVVSAKAKLSESRSLLKRVDASLAAAEAEFDRTEDLVQRGSLQTRMLDEVRKKRDSIRAAKTAASSSIESAEAQVTVAEAELSAAQADRIAAVAGEGLSESELYTIGYYAVRNKMGGLKGVQIPHPFGGKFRQMMVYVDPAKLHAYHLSGADVVEAMRKSNLVLASGTARMGGTDYQIHPRNTLPTTEEIAAVPITVRDGRPIFIRDVARVEDDAALQYNIVRVNGKRSVYCPLLREPGENTIAVVDRIYEGIGTEIPKMIERGDIPAATEVTLVSDQSSYIRKAMSNLMTQIGLGAVLVAAVVVIFLRRLVPSIIIATIVFAVLIGALGFAFSGQTINVLALSIVPAFCATFVREKFADRQNPDDQPRDPLPRGLYGRILSAAMAAPAATTAVIVAVIGGCALLWPAIGSELFPTVDSGSFEIRIKTLPGTELLETEKLVARIEASIKEVIPAEEIETLIANIGLPVGKGAGFSTVLSLNAGPDTAYLIVNLKQRNRSTPSGEYIERLRTKLAEDYPLEQFLFVSGGIVNMALNEGVPTPISVQVSAGTLQQCRDAAERIVAAIELIAGTRDVQIAQSLDYPQFDVQVDRARAKYLGVDQEEVAQTILTALGSSAVMRQRFGSIPSRASIFSWGFNTKTTVSNRWTRSATFRSHWTPPTVRSPFRFPIWRRSSGSTFRAKSPTTTSRGSTTCTSTSPAATSVRSPPTSKPCWRRWNLKTASPSPSADRWKRCNRGSACWASGNEAMIPLARALLGGMVASTLLTLVLVPCVYALVHRDRGGLA